MKRLLAISFGFLAAMNVSACREAVPEPERFDPATASVTEANVVASRLAAARGDSVVLLVRVSPGPGSAAPASFALRLGYEPDRLRFVAEQPIDDAGLRAINGEIPGDLRAAGASPSAFVGGELVGLRFVALGDGSIGSLRLSVNQLTGVDGAGLGGVVVRAPAIDASVAR